MYADRLHSFAQADEIVLDVQGSHAFQIVGSERSDEPPEVSGAVFETAW